MAAVSGPRRAASTRKTKPEAKTKTSPRARADGAPSARARPGPRARPLDGRVAVVTGAAAGLGRAIADRLAADGAIVVASDVDAQGALATAAALTARGDTAHGVHADVSDPRAVERMFADVASLGPVAILVNNAGVHQRPPEDGELSFDAVIGVNLGGVRHTLKHALPIMRAHGRGAVINISSNLALAPWRHQPLYSSSKAGVLGLTKSVARHMGGFGVRVNAICPGAFPTRLLSDTGGSSAVAERVFAHLSPLGRIGRLDELSAAVAWLASDEASDINGAVLLVDGGTASW